MAEHPIQGLMGVTMEKIREMVDADTIVGAPIQAAEGVTILPISKVTFGFASGGSDIGSKTSKDLFGGGGGAGVSIAPIAFLVIQNGNVRTIQLADHASTVDRALNMVPELVDKLSELLKKNKEEDPGGEATE